MGMVSSKLVALCVCPALLAPPVVLAVNKRARHAVARVLHRAANRLDHAPDPAPVQYAALPCAPTFAGDGDGVLLPAGGLGSFRPLDNRFASASPGDGGGFTPVSFGGGGHGGGSGGNPGGGGTGGPVVAPASPSPPIAGGGDNGGEIVRPTSPTVRPPASQTNVPVATVAEPRTWAMLIAGFGAVGAALRHRRLAAA